MIIEVLARICRGELAEYCCYAYGKYKGFGTNKTVPFTLYPQNNLPKARYCLCIVNYTMEQRKSEEAKQNNVEQDQDIRKGTELAKEQASGEQTQRDGKADEEVRQSETTQDQANQPPTTEKL